jgi:hypothetical protein
VLAASAESLPFDSFRYTVAYTDFFDAEVKEKQGDWGRVLDEYLYSGPEPLVNGATGGCMCNLSLFHPFRD